MYHPHGVVVLTLFHLPLCTLHRLSLLPFLIFIFHVGSVRSTPCTSANEELGTLAENDPNYQISETTEIFIQESSSDSRSSNLHDLEIDDYTIGRALSSPLFTQEREDPASRRQAHHFLDESLLSSRSLSVGHVRTGKTCFR